MSGLEASNELATMMAAAREAGAGLMKRFAARDELLVREKVPGDFVSNADLESEQTLRTSLLGAYPGFGFLAEESAEERHSGAVDGRFIVDPLDGTTNFLHGMAHFAIAIALEREGRVVAGVVFDPAKDEMFVAERARGAWLGSQRLRVSPHAELASALVGTGIPHANGTHRHATYLPKLAAVMRESAGIRRLGAAALDLAYVASGRFAVFFEFGLKPWDLAAGALLVTEAGGAVSTPAGAADVLGCGDVLATNGRLHPRLLGLLGVTPAA